MQKLLANNADSLAYGGRLGKAKLDRLNRAHFFGLKSRQRLLNRARTELKRSLSCDSRLGIIINSLTHLL